MHSTPALEARALTKRYGRQVVVDDVTFTARAGAVTAFLGPNGAGKSTTLRMLLGLVRPSSGEALVLGRPLGDHAHPAEVVGALLDTEQFHPGRAGRQHLRVLAAAAGLPAARVEEVLAQVDLTTAAGRRVGTYSLGMRQRLGIAAALLGRPRVLVLDEPGNGLDPIGMRWLRQLLRDFAADGGAVLVSSHQLAEVAQLADDVVVVDAGRVVAQHPVADLTTAAGGIEEAFFALTKGGAR